MSEAHDALVRLAFGPRRDVQGDFDVLDALLRERETLRAALEEIAAGDVDWLPCDIARSALSVEVGA